MTVHPFRPRESADLVSRMADDLRRFEATATESDAIRSLMGRYSTSEIAWLVDEALFEARQGILQDIMAAAA